MEWKTACHLNYLDKIQLTVCGARGVVESFMVRLQQADVGQGDRAVQAVKKMVKVRARGEEGNNGKGCSLVAAHS